MRVLVYLPEGGYTPPGLRHARSHRMKQALMILIFRGFRNSGFRGASSIAVSEIDVLFRGGSKFSALPAARFGLMDRDENKIIIESKKEFIFFKNSRPRVDWFSVR